MTRRRNFPTPIPVFLIFLALVAPGRALAKEDNAPLSLEARADRLESAVKSHMEEVEDILQNFSREAQDRDKLVLQRRFVTGRDFYFDAQDYRGAADIFYGIINHPAAHTIPSLADAQYYLAESLFHMGHTDGAREGFIRLRSMAPEGRYAGIALVRLTQTAILRGDFSSAEDTYAKLLSRLPEYYDGSLGRYIFGKALYEKGDTARAGQILEDIPRDQDYYPVGQYFLAVMEVEAKNYSQGIDRLRRLRESLKTGSDRERAVYTQTHLALGRLHYEMEDFPQAESYYLKVPVDSPYFADAMYESLWVQLTRNDQFLKRFRKELAVYDKMSLDYEEYAGALEPAADQEKVTPLLEEIDALQDTLTDIREMFDLVEERLENLQAEAAEVFVKLVENAPQSPLLPEAELLMGDIYSQADNPAKAKEQFEKVLAKYSALRRSLQENAGRLGDGGTLIQIVEFARSPDGSPRTLPAGVPEETAQWLSADPAIQKVFAVYENALALKRGLDEIRDLISRIEVELARLERDTSFPFFKEAHRRSLELNDKAGRLKGEIAVLLGESGDDEEMVSRLHSLDSMCDQGVSQLDGLDSELEKRKEKTLALYRQSFRELVAPIASFEPRVENIYALAADAAARSARSGLQEIQARLLHYEQKARVGIIDADYRKTEASARKIKSIQKAMNDELRRFRLRYRKSQGFPAPTDQEETEAASEEQE